MAGLVLAEWLIAGVFVLNVALPALLLKIGLALAVMQMRADSAPNVARHALKVTVGTVTAAQQTKAGSAKIAARLGGNFHGLEGIQVFKLRWRNKF